MEESRGTVLDAELVDLFLDRVLLKLAMESKH